MLTYEGDIAYRPDAFACNLTPRPEERVLSLKQEVTDGVLYVRVVARGMTILIR